MRHIKVNEDELNKNVVMTFAVAILVAAAFFIGLWVHSCVNNPDGPDEFSVGNASRP